MAISFRHLILSFAALVSVVALNAAPPASVEEKPAVPLRFYYLNAASQDTVKGVGAIEFMLESGGLKQSCTLTPSGVSETVLYRGPLPVTIFRERKTETGVVRETIGRIEFPEQWKGAFFIVTRAPATEATPYRFYPIEYWGPSLPERHARVVNLCPLPLAVKLAGSLAMVPASGTADVDITSAVRDLPIVMAVQPNGNTAWQTLISSALPAPRNQRALLLAFPDAGAAHHVRTLLLDELPEPPPVAGAGAVTAPANANGKTVRVALSN